MFLLLTSSPETLPPLHYVAFTTPSSPSYSCFSGASTVVINYSFCSVMPIKCLLKGPFSALGQLQTTENPLQILKALFIPCDMNIFALTFCLCRKRAWYGSWGYFQNLWRHKLDKQNNFIQIQGWKMNPLEDLNTGPLEWESSFTRPTSNIRNLVR